MTWHHDTLPALAKALGVTVRTLDQWKKKGAPMAAAPYDELAIRLWHAREAITAGGKAVTLADPAPTVQPYIDLAVAAIEAQRLACTAAAEDPATAIKLAQAKKLDLHNQRAERLLLDEAQAAFRTWTGSLAQAITRSLTPATMADLWKAAQTSRLQAEPTLKRLILALTDAAILSSLDRAQADVTKAKR